MKGGGEKSNIQLLLGRQGLNEDVLSQYESISPTYTPTPLLLSPAFIAEYDVIKHGISCLLLVRVGQMSWL